MIVERVIEAKAAKMQQWPVRSNRASECGHPCERYLVFNRTRWQEKTLPRPELQFIFDLGNILEPAVIRDLQDAGFSVNQTQRGFEWKEYDITGSIDGKIVVDGQAWPLEIKTMSPYVFNGINSVEDMTKGRYLYLRKYPTQLNLYCLMDNKEKGVFILKNKVNGAMKEVWMSLDYDLGEATLKKIERVNRHIEHGFVPDPIEWDDDICGECPFLHICLPDRTVDAMKIEDDTELLSLLNQREALVANHKQYEEIDKEIKERIKERDKLLVGPWFIEGGWKDRKGYEVKPSRYWQSKIIKVA
ncbi:MAG: hypothetical protein PHY29_02855 [Syntrophales bacterium]|nr:hypothetical protein [Syntrophales bacterium]